MQEKARGGDLLRKARTNTMQAEVRISMSIETPLNGLQSLRMEWVLMIDIVTGKPGFHLTHGQRAFAMQLRNVSI